MAKTRLQVIIRNGVIEPVEPLALPENTPFWITVEIAEEAGIAPGVQSGSRLAQSPAGWQNYLTALSRIRGLSRVITLEGVLFALGLLVYAYTRLWALDQFPIFFFTDEAIHPVHAAELIHNGLRDGQGTFLPAYFQNGAYWNLSLSVYLHVIPVFLLGKSILVTRATSALISLLGAAAVGLALKLVFKNRFWWIGVLFMTVIPAWFLHSRTAFETVMMVSFYACFILFYLLYRNRSPRYLFPALIFGAATFYAYANGQAVMAATSLFLLVFDLRYHLRHRRIALAGVLLIGLLVLPYVRFRISHPDALQDQLRILDSYWLKPMPIGEKLVRFRDTYLYGLSPQYWFFPNNHDLVRHLMKGYPHIRTELLPLFLAGLGVSLWRFRSSAHRTLIFALLAAPIGAATVGVGVTRVLAFVVPVTLLACLGLDWLLTRLTSQWRIRVLSLVLFVVLSFMGYSMLQDALINGPVWYKDYGLYGMQWGARPLFSDVIPQYLRNNPRTRLMVSPTWANGADVFTLFFLPRQDWPRVQMLNVDYFLLNQQPLDDSMVHVMTNLEYERARTSGKFKSVVPESVLNYPDGTPGFYFVHLAYVDNVDAIFAAEREARRRLVEDKVNIGGQVVQVRHSLLDSGAAFHMFDGDRFTLARVMEANPAIVELNFPEPRKISSLVADFAVMDFTWNILLYAQEGAAPVIYQETYRGIPGEPHVEIAFNRGPEWVSKMRLEIKDLNSGERAKIHIRELTLR